MCHAAAPVLPLLHLVVLLLLPPPFLVLVLMQVLVLLLMPLVLVLVHLLLLLFLLVVLPLLATAAVPLLALVQQRAARRETTKRNDRALQPIKVKIDRRVMCPWAGKTENDATAGGAKKTVSVVMARDFRYKTKHLRAPYTTRTHSIRFDCAIGSEVAISATRPSPSLRAASPKALAKRS
jgi:hypothetical protein